MPELPPTLRGQLRTLLPDEGYTITADEVMASVEHSRVEASPTSDPTPVVQKRRVTSLAPALAWMLGILVLAAMGVGIFVGVKGTSPGKPVSEGAIGKLTDRLVLDKAQVIAGQTVSGSVVIYNPGKSFVVEVCDPPVQVLLNRGNFHQQPINNLMFCDGHLRLIHGTTQLAITVTTTQDGCVQSGPSQPPFPACLADGEPPPLPTGTYMANVAWGDSTLPEPKGVALTLVAKSHASVGPPVTAPLASCTTQNLHTVVQVTEGTAEHWVIFLRFINVSNQTCTLMGSPYVTFLDAAGHQVGLPAQNGGPGTKVFLTPGSSALSGVWESESQLAPTNGFRCSIAHAEALKVEAPGQETAVIVKGSGGYWPEAMVICSNQPAQADPVTSYH